MLKESEIFFSTKKDSRKSKKIMIFYYIYYGYDHLNWIWVMIEVSKWKWIIFDVLGFRKLNDMKCKNEANKFFLSQIFEFKISEIYEMLFVCY